MAIKDLQARQGQVDLIADVVEKAEPREFEKFGKKGKVCNAKIKDETGEMTLTLWNEQTETVKVGDKVHVINGWVSEWQGEKQLSTGKFGQLEVVEKGTAVPAPSKAPEKNASAMPKQPERKEVNYEDIEKETDDEVYKDEEEVY
ncbi:MAG TPA: SOSS complex subunit B family protein [Candidatus Nanoarchaeia archaeon]|nr:SOSS complex subunit B family protein [Candidatus Nanoarchaeia archaeon]